MVLSVKEIFTSFSSLEKFAFRFAIPETGSDEKRMQIRLIHFFTALALATSAPLAYSAGNDFSDVKAQVAKQHDEAVKRLQDWIKQVSIAASFGGDDHSLGSNCFTSYMK